MDFIWIFLRRRRSTDRRMVGQMKTRRLLFRKVFEKKRRLLSWSCRTIAKAFTTNVARRSMRDGGMKARPHPRRILLNVIKAVKVRGCGKGVKPVLGPAVWVPSPVKVRDFVKPSK